MAGLLLFVVLLDLLVQVGQPGQLVVGMVVGVRVVGVGIREVWWLSSGCWLTLLWLWL